MKWALLGSVVMSVAHLADFGFQLGHLIVTTGVGLLGLSIQEAIKKKYPIYKYKILKKDSSGKEFIDCNNFYLKIKEALLSVP